MQIEVIAGLRQRAAEIQRRWEILLRVEPVSGPLANPDALKHLIPLSLERVWSALERGAESMQSIAAARAATLPQCRCGNNPYLAYFTAAEQAMLEALIHLQVESPGSLRREADLVEMVAAIRGQAREEIDTFCGVCLHRCQVQECRHLTGS